ncbi:putative glyoxalase superfamily protein PhnB [Herbihabitans rhizosphaerae]|uniref:Putative glyoxalase superfamily protein PhnB n=1 Tax=Herbihabitans rhizosphaerae TaxID=1872711 RepID=A0A4Q7KTX7_9PSEU|nr:VOC family protein [Herbihabitans rhizosphaerae]RZS38902.1 putative glyoxalase superfamily protein PhnB [Herbihabitans rhizosphaerae]
MTYTGVTPYLYYTDAAAALDWLTATFGFGPDVRYTAEDGTVEEAEITAGPARVMMAGRAPGADEGGGALIIVHTDDVDALYRRVDGAGVAVEPPADQPWGPRTITVTDPWGYRWNFWQGEALPPE